MNGEQNNSEFTLGWKLSKEKVIEHNLSEETKNHIHESKCEDKILQNEESIELQEELNPQNFQQELEIIQQIDETSLANNVNSSMISASSILPTCFQWNNLIKDNEFTEAYWGHKIHIKWMKVQISERIKVLRINVRVCLSL